MYLELVNRSELIDFLLKSETNFGDDSSLFQVRDGRQILFLILVEFKLIN